MNMKKLTAALALTLSLNIAAPASALWIADVSENDWSYPYVVNLLEQGVMQTDEWGYFYPDVPTTRAEFVHSIWYAFGCPQSELAVSFNDISEYSPYAEAVAWALEAGITTGIGDGRFGPSLTLPREQAFTFLYRAMDYMGSAPQYDEGSEFCVQIAEFYDYEEISDWARDTIQLMMNVGLVTGSDTGYLWPKQDLNNAATAAVLYRSLVYMGLIAAG